jgi:hypothetical protein
VDLVKYSPSNGHGYEALIIQHYLSLSRQNCFVYCFLTLSSLPQDQNLVVFIKLNRPISWSGLSEVPVKDLSGFNRLVFEIFFSLLSINIVIS